LASLSQSISGQFIEHRMPLLLYSDSRNNFDLPL
jgi:hypothetical protein